jgi:hypothetical protein
MGVELPEWGNPVASAHYSPGGDDIDELVMDLPLKTRKAQTNYGPIYIRAICVICG